MKLYPDIDFISSLFKVTTSLVSEQADIGCNRQSSLNESKQLSSDESKGTSRNNSSYKKVHHSNNISFQTV